MLYTLGSVVVISPLLVAVEVLITVDEVVEGYINNTML